MNFDELPLGKNTDYPTSFSRDILSRIPRSDSRQKLPESESSQAFNGYDLWTLYELNWVSTSGVPQALIGEIRVPANSEFIVESKSLKLYINSLYYRRFDSAPQVSDEISLSLTELLGAQVRVHLWPLADFGTQPENRNAFINLDQCGAEVSNTAGLQSLHAVEIQDYFKCYKTDCFRSLCPVTGQPDWATIYIGLEGVKLDEEALASYLLGFSEHQGFHESCVEQIYVDLKNILSPQELTVAARFTRRGGIDINPYRFGKRALFDMPARGVRQ